MDLGNFIHSGHRVQQVLIVLRLEILRTCSCLSALVWLVQHYRSLGTPNKMEAGGF